MDEIHLCHLCYTVEAWLQSLAITRSTSVCVIDVKTLFTFYLFFHVFTFFILTIFYFIFIFSLTHDADREDSIVTVVCVSASNCEHKP